MEYRCKVEIVDNLFWVQFPDMPNVITYGFSHAHALEMAKEALDGCLESDVSQGNAIPMPKYKKGYPIIVSPQIVLSLRLRELRGKQSQTEVANKLGLSYQAYQRLENPRKANPTVKTLEKIAKVYGKKLQIAL